MSTYPVHQKFATLQEIKEYYANLIKIKFDNGKETGQFDLDFNSLCEAMTSMITEFIYEEIMIEFDKKEKYCSVV